MRTYCLLAMMMFWVSMVSAQNDTIAAPLAIDEVEVVGINHNDDMRSINPQFTLSSSDFQRLNIVDMSSALRRLPGIVLRDYGGAGGMKTVSVRGLGAQHTGVTLDGMMLPDGQSGMTDFQQFLLTDLSSMSLSMAGDDEIFLPARSMSRSSVIALDSRHKESSVALSVGSWGLVEPSLILARSIGKVDVSLGGCYARADNDYPFLVENGVDTHEEHRVNSASSQGSINMSVGWHINTDSEWNSFVRLFDNDRQLPGIVHLYTNDNDETLRDRGTLVQSQLTTRIAQRWWLKTAVRWAWNQQVYHNGIPSGGITSQRYISREYYATGAVMYKPAEDVALDYSLDCFHDAMTTTLQANPNPQRTSWLQSVAARWTPGRWRLVGSVLNSNVDSEHRLSPSLAVAYRVLSHDELFLRLSAKDIFRMPSMTELYYFHIGQTKLKPEATQQVNVGVTFANNRSPYKKSLEVEASVDAYLNRITDKIVCIPFNMFVSRFVNVSSVFSRGTDVAGRLSYNINNKVHAIALSVNYSYQRVGMRDVDEKWFDNQIAYTPEHSGSATLSWTNPWVNCSATITGATETWTNNEHNGTPVRGFKELSASVFRSFGVFGKELQTSLTMQNILNERYCIVAHYPMPGRNIKLSVKYNF